MTCAYACFLFYFFDRQTRMCMCLLYSGVFLCLCPVENWFFRDLSKTAMDKLWLLLN